MARRDQILQQLVCEHFIVTMKNGDAFDGLLDRVDDKTLEFVGASAIVPPKNEKAPIDGRLYLPRADVAFLQRPDGVTR